ncbi:MAG: ABC transporter permease [Phycisphaerales bacterium]
MTTAALHAFATSEPSRTRAILAFARRELRDAVSSRWFLLYTVAFAVLAVGVSFMSLAGTGSSGFAGFSRTAAGLLNLVMLVVPLMAITAGAGSIAGERERGTLLYLLAQPVGRTEVLLGKFIGLAVAIVSSICLGFGLSAAALAWRTGAVGVGAFLSLVGLACLLGVVSLAIGLCISAASRKTGVATGVGLFAWLTLVFLSDLGVMAGAILFKLRVQEVFGLAVLNPLQAFKMAVVYAMNASLDVLGPVGAYASHQWGSHLVWMLPGVLVAWGLVALIVAALLFSRRSPV